jgi:hypothetical protein
MNYIEKMDKQCISLCNAINKIPGLITYSSCCGHNKRKFNIYINALSIRNLFILARSLDTNYYKNLKWSLNCICTDVSECPVVFVLESFKKGRIAYKQSIEISKRIINLLNDKAVTNNFNIYEQ